MIKKENTIILGSNLKSEKVEFSKLFRRDYLNLKENPILLKQSILVTNLLFQIVMDLKNNMYHTDNKFLYSPEDKNSNQIKMNLWENEFINSDKNEIKKVYKTSFFLKNRNKKQMTEALEFLKNYKNETYTFTKNGKTLTTSGGLIKDWYFSDTTGNFEITISLYWADKIVTLEPTQWNNLNVDVIKKFTNNKQRLFVLWLTEVKKYAGTKKNYEEILSLYDLNYSDINELIRGFLLPIKMKLDDKTINIDWISFNMFIDKENCNNIRIVPYDVKPKKDVIYDDSVLEDVKKGNEEYQKKIVIYKLKYIKRRHNLTEENSRLIKILLDDDFSKFEKNYKIFLNENKKTKTRAVQFENNMFLEEINKIYALK